MKVFISSLITGMESYRAAAREAVESLDYEPIMAEDFHAKPQSPQIACLDGVRQSGLVVLLLGSDYGAKQKSGLSATHEEYREAKGKRSVMAFLRSDVTPDHDQALFIKEVQGWETGLFRGSFSAPEDLRKNITRAIHAWKLATVIGPLDTKTLSAMAMAAARVEQEKHRPSGESLVLSVAVGPTQPILRPTEIEKASLSNDLMREATFGQFPIFSHADGTEPEIEDNHLVIQQGRGTRIVKLDTEGNILFRLALEKERGSFAIIKEVLEPQIVKVLRYAAVILDYIDPSQKLTHVALAASLAGDGFSIIRTQAEHNASPGSFQISGWGQNQDIVQLQPPHRPRAALNHDAEKLAEDLVTLLRRSKR